MNSRERVIRAIEFKGPDRVPITHSCLPAALLKYGKKLEQIFNRYPSDFNGYVAETFWENIYRKGEFRDEWGCLWKNLTDGIIGQVTKPPLARWEALESYHFPDPLKAGDFNKVEQDIRAKGHEKYNLGSAVIYFHRMHLLRGFSNILMDLVIRRKELQVLSEGILNYNLGNIKKFLEFDVDGIAFLDDWGTQRGLFIRPSLWREFFKPAYKEMFRVVHKAGKHVFFHSDGYIIDIIPDLIECGVDVLNPQMAIMGIDKLSERFGGKLCFLSDLDRQHILPKGSAKEVRQHIKHVIKAFGNFNGGLIGQGEIGPDVPLTNVTAMFEAFKKYGRYPLKV